MTTDPFATEPAPTTPPAAQSSPEATFGQHFYGQTATPQPTAWAQFSAPPTTPVPATTVPAPMVNPYPNAVEHPQNIPGLVCGIIGVCGAFPVGIASLVMGIRANNDIQRNPSRYTGRGMAIANIVLGSISTAATVMAILFVLFFVTSVMMW